jgi:hypothetical protein
LTAGLTRLPAGVDAREVTAVLGWWLREKDKYTPALEFSVLHVRDLVRALRVPLPGYGGANLDSVGLGEVRSHCISALGVSEICRHREGEIENHKLATEDEKGAKRKGKRTAVKGRGNALEVNLARETVSPRVEIQIRHVLTFPFLGMQRLVGAAFEMGVRNAEARRDIRERGRGRGASVGKRKLDGAEGCGGGIASGEEEGRTKKKMRLGEDDADM